MKYTFLCFTMTLLLQQAVFGQTTALPTKPQGEAKQATSSEEENPYLRILYNDREDPVAMQTSIVTFQYRDGKRPDVTVDLIGAVHVADQGYFDKLDRLFTGYDALLYELVAPANNNVPTGGKSQHPVGQMQQTMKSWLELDYQLEEIDYSKKNFVHADMSPDEFARVMNERGESFFQMMMRAMGAAMAKQSATGRSTDFELMFAFGAKDRSLRLKRIMSTQFSDLESSMKAIEGENGSTIIGQRNKKALDVLQREIAKGKKKIGIFYGAGHMPDMEKRMAARFGLVPAKQPVKWLTAWDMSGK